MANNHFYRDMMRLLSSKVCQQIEDGRAKETMAELGLTSEQIKLFCNLNQMQIEQLSRSRVQLFSVKINTESLDFFQRELKNIELIERCIKIGSSNEFLNCFFGLTSRDACSKRLLKDIDAKKIKRTVSLKQADLIIDNYLAISQNGEKPFGAKEYCDLFDKLRDSGNECSLKAIWVTVLDFNEGKQEKAK